MLRDPTTIAATNKPVKNVAATPARMRSAVRVNDAGNVSSAACCSPKKSTALVRHRAAERRASSANPGQIMCKWSRKKPSSKGGKNPPSPPIAPTRPVTVPTSLGKYCGTSLNTAPLPFPSTKAHPRAPKENGLENTSASDFIRYPTAQRASQGCQHNKTGSTKPGVRRFEPELVLEQDRQVDRKCNKSTESQEVKKGKHPR